MTDLVKRMQTKLEKWSDVTNQSTIGATVLFAKMNECADGDEFYKNELTEWVDGKTDTFALRDLAAMFGCYWTNNDHAIAVDTLDTANVEKPSDIMNTKTIMNTWSRFSRYELNPSVSSFRFSITSIPFASDASLPTDINNDTFVTFYRYYKQNTRCGFFGFVWVGEYKGTTVYVSGPNELKQTALKTHKKEQRK